MEWIELLIETDETAEEIVSEYLWLLGSTGVSVKNRKDFENLPDDDFGTILGEIDLSQYAKHPLVLGYFDGNSSMDGIIAEFNQYIESYNVVATDHPVRIYNMRYKKIISEEWENKWKSYYHPIQISKFLSVVPVWEEYTPESETEVSVYLDPGMAFGTGSHPTTELILLLLETTMRSGFDVIDVGTGSGILAIAAKKLGANRVWAYEYDESVIETAKANVALNGDMKDVSVHHNDKLKGVTQKVNLICANILSDVLMPLIPQAYDTLDTDGIFLLSGIYKANVEEIKSTLIQTDFTIEQILQRGDWFAIYAKKGRENRCKDTL